MVIDVMISWGTHTVASGQAQGHATKAFFPISIVLQMCVVLRNYAVSDLFVYIIYLIGS